MDIAKILQSYQSSGASPVVKKQVFKTLIKRSRKLTDELIKQESVSTLILSELDLKN